MVRERVDGASNRVNDNWIFHSGNIQITLDITGMCIFHPQSKINIVEKSFLELLGMLIVGFAV